MKSFKKHLPVILMILFEIVIAILLLIDPEKFTIVTFIIFGCVLVLCALGMLLRFLRDRKAVKDYEKAKEKVANSEGVQDEKTADRKYGEAKLSYLPLVSAIITAALGAVFIFGASALYNVTTLLLIFYGAIMLIKGLVKIVNFFAQRKTGEGVSALHLISGIFSIALGLLMMIFPGSSRSVAFVIGAISLLVEAVVDIIALVLSIRIEKKLVAEAKAKEVKTIDSKGYDLDNFKE